MAKCRGTASTSQTPINKELKQIDDVKMISLGEITPIANDLPKLTKNEQNQFNSLFCNWIYTTGTPFSKVESNLLSKSLKILRPDVIIPNRKEIGGKYLDENYNELSNKINNFLKKPSTKICLTSDGWTNVNSFPIINYMAVTCDGTFFIESSEIDGASHNAEYITSEITKIIEKISVNNICGVVTDNTNTNKAVWSMLKQKFPRIFFYGCICHTLHLLVKDLTNSIGWLQELSNSTNDIYNFFKSHNKIRYELVTKQLKNGIKQLVKAVPTRWGTLLGQFQSIFDSDAILNEIITGRNFISHELSNKDKENRTHIKKIIQDNNWQTNLKNGIDLLSPINRILNLFQSDLIPLSEVYYNFIELLTMKQFDNFNNLDRNIIFTAIKSRFAFIYNEAHAIAYLLDPRFLGII